MGFSKKEPDMRAFVSAVFDMNLEVEGCEARADPPDVFAYLFAQRIH